MSAWCWEVSRAIDKKGIWGHSALARQYSACSKIQCLGRQEQRWRFFSIRNREGEGFIPVVGGILKLPCLRHAQCPWQQLANHLLLTFLVCRTRSELELAFSMSVEQASSLHRICFIRPIVFVFKICRILPYFRPCKLPYSPLAKSEWWLTSVDDLFFHL